MNIVYNFKYMRKILLQMFFIVTFLTFLSCSRTNEMHFDSSENGFLVYNNDDSLSFDTEWNLMNSTVSLRDDVSKVSFKNDSLINILSPLNNKIYTLWLDSLFNPKYIENIHEKEIQYSDSIGMSIQYGRDSNLEELVIYFTFIQDEHIMMYSLNQYLVYKNDEIDTLRSSFYVVEESDSGGIFKLYNRQDIEGDYYYQVIYFTDPFLELSPVSIAGNLYIEDTAKHKEILYFRKGQDPFITYDNDIDKPTVFQVYVFKTETREPIDYRLGVINSDYSTEKKIKQIKNDVSQKFDQYKVKSYLKDIEKSLQGFPFVTVKSQAVVEVDKEKLKELYSKYKSKK
ncbi:hypothetical protein [Brumimicrobium sp.]|uniref:hypothetical protein n=1 Tax=Brumimicrobium sp. TaxID=2029867 RepID=UPI003A909310